MKQLSRRQQSILEFIEAFTDERSYPPTIREIQEGLSISSTSVVDYNLNVLEQHNVIRRNRNISRGIELASRPAVRRGVVAIPVIGRIAAGEPIPVPDDLRRRNIPIQSNWEPTCSALARMGSLRCGSRDTRWLMRSSTMATSSSCASSKRVKTATRSRSG